MGKIYTRTGDDGTTGRIGGKRVPKDAPSIEACGCLDELNALLGVVRSHVPPDKVDQVLRRIQDHLFIIGAELAKREGAAQRGKIIGIEEVRSLEKEIDAFEDSLPPLKEFILPGGGMVGAGLHMARTVARRAERRCVALSRCEKINPQILCYLNRLSDLCFVLARYANWQQSVPEQKKGTVTGIPES